MAACIKISRRLFSCKRSREMTVSGSPVLGFRNKQFDDQITGPKKILYIDKWTGLPLIYLTHLDKHLANRERASVGFFQAVVHLQDCGRWWYC